MLREGKPEERGVEAVVGCGSGGWRGEEEAEREDGEGRPSEGGDEVGEDVWRGVVRQVAEEAEDD